MKKENGLKRIYRFLGIGSSHIIYKFSKNLNPNGITVSGFIILILGWLQYLTMYLFYEVLLLNTILLIITFNIALIIDYVDGEYARKVNRCSKRGQHLDGILDFIKISITYILIYLTTKDQITKLLIFTSSVIFTIFMWSRYSMYRENLIAESSKEGKLFSLSLLFSFSVAHQYLYFSIYLLFGLWQIIILQILIGLAFTSKNFIKLMKTAKKLDKAGLSNEHLEETIDL